MAGPTRYVITRKAGVDTLHVNPREECNLDDTDTDEEVDEETAGAMLGSGIAQRCGHCAVDYAAVVAHEGDPASATEGTPA